MGNCFPAGHSLKFEKLRKPSFLETYNVDQVLKKRGSRILKEDRDHFFENEEWFKELIGHNNGKSYLDIQKFLENYPHYKLDQVYNKNIEF